MLVALLCLPLTASAGDWYRDWWENVYQQRIEKEQYQQAIQGTDTRCEAKVQWYKQKVQENPNSDYYQLKLEEWLEKCDIVSR